MSRICDKAKVLQIIREIAKNVIANKDYLTELDTKIGDADHGISMNRGFEAVLAKLPEVEDKCVGTIFKTVGMTLVSTVGGASGPLYGTAFMYAGNQVTGKEALNLEDAIKMINAALDGILKRGKANPGDKTMVDTLHPVVEFLNSVKAEGLEGKDCAEVFKQAEEVARQGMESTKPMMAIKGRASFLKERSIGHLDPGAVSSYLVIKTIAEELQNEV